MNQFYRWVRQCAWSLFSLGLMLTLVFGVFLIYLEQQLPDVATLKTVQLQVPLRIYTHDGKLIAEYGEKRRIPVGFAALPQLLVKAVLATEDQRFYEHAGIDFLGLLRAAKHLVATGTKGQGGSTITMQVARNFFLTRQKTYTRKLKEILLAVKIDRQVSKDKILELYLNKIFFGQRAYGIAAAAQVYYGAPLDQLTLAQLAMLAGLPKAPSSLNPLVNPAAAMARRNHVLNRMRELHYIDEAAYQQAKQSPLSATYHHAEIEFDAPYIAEMARYFLLEKFGPSIYTQGLQVYTTVNSHIQHQAQQAIVNGLLSYEERHGFRGPISHLTLPANEHLNEWLQILDQLPVVHNLQPAAVTAITEQTAELLRADGQQIQLNWQGLRWARKRREDLGWTPAPNTTQDILAVGDIVYIRQQTKAPHAWQLTQMPEVEGALVSLDPRDGSIQALVGGFNFYHSKFNRVWQADRQPGSSLKPFIYAAALSKGYTLASTINDAPVVLHDTGDETLWRPQNDTRKFYGPTRLRVGLTRSRNLVSIRLLQDISVDYARKFLQRFCFSLEQLPDSLSLALGTGHVTPLDLAKAYAVFANGGHRIDPYLVDYALDVEGQLFYQAEPRYVIKTLTREDTNIQLATQTGQAERVVSADLNYLMTQVLRDVIQHGTGRLARVLGRDDLAGKTGTTNDQLDAWFTGYNGTLVSIVWVGYDKPRSLREYGAQAALPIWIDFMRTALKGQPQTKLTRPSSIVTARIDPGTGLLATSRQKDAIFENFRKQFVPKRYAQQTAVQLETKKGDEAPEPLF